MGGVFGLFSVAAGAFGAHALRSRVSADLVQIFETAARYQMFHALALIATGVLAARTRGAWMNVAGAAFVAGTVLFSGSLYLLVLTGERWMGAITPFGGVAFLAGWAAFSWGALSLKARNVDIEGAQ